MDRQRKTKIAMDAGVFASDWDVFNDFTDERFPNQEDERYMSDLAQKFKRNDWDSDVWDSKSKKVLKKVREDTGIMFIEE